MANKKLSTAHLNLERQFWKKVLADILNPAEKDLFIRRKEAVDMYISGIPLKVIEERTKINKTAISRWVEKCCKIDSSTNEAYGYSALLHYKHTEKYTRKKESINPSSSNGLFELLLLNNPSLVNFISDNYFGDKIATLEKSMRVSTLHKKFLEECHRFGIQDYEYPFNSDSQGARALRRYIDKLQKEKEQLAIKRQGKNARQKYNSTGKGRKYSISPKIPYLLVQLDGHKIDMLYTVPVQYTDGSISYLPATRMWLIAVIDVASRAILGYSLCSEQNYSQTDVLAAVQDALKPRKRLEFTISGLEYPENGGFPCFALEETNWAMFDEIMLDNAKAHLAHDVVNKLVAKLGCAVNFGSVATPETRGIVERFFGKLEENGYHRLPSTTGSNINDVRRENAEKDAVKYQVTYDDIVEITEYLIAIYNNSPHSNFNNRTPLQIMEDRIKKAGMLPCIANSTQKETIESLTNLIIQRTVRGSYKSGKRPYITYENVEYRNDVISISYNLVGQNIFIEVNPDDISSVLAYTEDGVELGYLRAAGDWGLHPHSLKTRKDAFKSGRKNKAQNRPFFASLTGYENDLRDRASKSRVARTKKARLHRELQKEQDEHDVSEKNALNTFQEPNNNKLKSEAMANANTQENIKNITNDNKNRSDDYLENLDGMSFEEAYAKGLFK